MGEKCIFRRVLPMKTVKIYVRPLINSCISTAGVGRSHLSALLFDVYDVKQKRRIAHDVYSFTTASVINSLKIYKIVIKKYVMCVISLIYS